MNQIITNPHPPEGIEAILIISYKTNSNEEKEEVKRKIPSLIEYISGETGATLLETINRQEISIGIQAESHLTITTKELEKGIELRIEDFTCGPNADPRKIITQTEMINKYLGIKRFERKKGTYWERGRIKGLNEEKIGDYHSIEIRGIEKELLNDKEFLGALGEYIIKSTNRKKPEEHYSFEFREELNNPESPVDGYSGFVREEKNAFYYHTYPKDETILASYSLNKRINQKKLEEKIRNFLESQGIKGEIGIKTINTKKDYQRKA